MALTRRVFPLVLFFGLGLAFSPRAAAHALVIEASPAIDSNVSGPGIEFVLRFNSRIDRDRSRLILIGPDGMNRRLAVSQDSSLDTLKANASALAPGSYKLRWQVLAIDGHITRGDIPFRITAP